MLNTIGSRQLFKLTPAGQLSPSSPRLKAGIERPQGTPLKVVSSWASHMIIYSDLNVEIIDGAGDNVLVVDSLRARNLVGYELGNILEWKILGDELVWYGSIRPRYKSSGAAKGPPQTGYFHGHINKNTLEVSNVAPLVRVDDQDYHLLGNSYLTGSGDSAYFLVLSGGIAKLYMYKAGNLKRLNSLPPQFVSLTGFKEEATGPEHSLRRFREVGAQTMPVGLYAQGDLLLLLGREKIGGATIWTIHALDPQADRNLGHTVLPTSALHLSAVPSLDRWFFFERSEVVSNQIQAIESLLSVPATWISSPKDSPLSPQSSVAGCLSINSNANAAQRPRD